MAFNCMKKLRLDSVPDVWIHNSDKKETQSHDTIPLTSVAEPVDYCAAPAPTDPAPVQCE
jgi:hypothetical protein